MRKIKLNDHKLLPENYTGMVEFTDGEKHWRSNGYLHRVDGPALITKNGCKFWFSNGKHHRENGPAIEWSHGHVEYWYQGQFLKKEKIYFLTNLGYPIKTAIKLSSFVYKKLKYCI